VCGRAAFCFYGAECRGFLCNFALVFEESLRRKTWIKKMMKETFRTFLGGLLLACATGAMPVTVVAQDVDCEDTVVPDSLDFDYTDTADSATTDCPSDSFVCTVNERLSHLVEEPMAGRSQIGLYVYDLTAHRPLFGHNVRQTLRPASTMKVVTALAALTFLGEDYRFRTKLLADGEVTADSVLRGTLSVVGGFDPLFGEEDMQAFMAALRREGIRRIEGDIVLDVSMKDTLPLGNGWCWDDSREVSPLLTPLPYDKKDTFVQELKRHLLAEGILLTGSIGKGCASGREICVREHTLDEVFRPMMKKSNNFCAEAVFYSLAAKSGKPGAGREEAARYINDLVKIVGLSPKNYTFADGSGLSQYNYVSPELLVSLLRYAYRHKDLYRHLQPALPVAGEDGTMRRRLCGTGARGRVFAKTGTVTGVSTLCGYLQAYNGHLLCFAIMNQGIRKSAQGRAFQDRVCLALVEE